MPARTGTAHLLFIAVRLLKLRQTTRVYRIFWPVCDDSSAKSTLASRARDHSAATAAAGEKITKQQDDDHERE